MAGWTGALDVGTPSVGAAKAGDCVADEEGAAEPPHANIVMIRIELKKMRGENAFRLIEQAPGKKRRGALHPNSSH